MSNGDQFVVVYPCFIPLGVDGEELLTVSADDHEAIVFLSDEDLLARFISGVFPRNSGTKVGAIECSDRTALLKALALFEAASAESGIEHIVIDPSAGRRCIYTTIREFADHVERIPA